MGRYAKVHRRLWCDAKFLALGDDAKLVFLCLLTHPAQTSIGAMRVTGAGLAEELGWTAARMRGALAALTEISMIRIDVNAHLITLPNFPNHNKPESPNVIMAWASAVRELPESPLIDAQIFSAGIVIETMSEPFQAAFAKAFGEYFRKPSGRSSESLSVGLSKGFGEVFANQEQEQDQEQDKRRGSPNGSLKLDAEDEAEPEPEPVAAWVLESWNFMAASAGVPTALKLGAARKRKIAARARDPEFRGQWAAAMEAIPEQPFLLGTNKQGWTVRLDWLLEERNLLKVCEGNYASKQRQQGDRAQFDVL